MSQANLVVVFDHLYARRIRDIARLAATLDPDVVHQGVFPELVCNNRNEVLDMMRRGFASDDFGVDRLELIDVGERVVVGLAGPRFQEPWAPLKGQLFVVFTLHDDRIVRMDDYLTRADALAAAGGTTRDWV